MRVLVTGAAGFIGCHVVDLLCDAGHQVVAVDHPDAMARGGAPRHPAAQWVSASTDDDRVLSLAVRGIDAVCHESFWFGPHEDMTDVRELVRRNDEATASLLLALHQSGYTGRIVLGSSASVYGEGSYRCNEHGLMPAGERRRDDLAAHRYEPTCPRCGQELAAVPVTEDAPVAPRRMTAVSRVHQEMLWTAYAGEHPGTTLTILRHANVYGPWMPRDTPLGGIIGVFRSQIEHNVRPQVLEDGGQRRDFVHVSDVARASVLALTAPEPYHGALNIGTGRHATLLEVATILCVARDSRLWPEVLDTARPADARHVLVDSGRAYDVLGFRARVSLQDGLSSFATAPMSGPDAVLVTV